jgi:hypothetical protein
MGNRAVLEEHRSYNLLADPKFSNENVEQVKLSHREIELALLYEHSLRSQRQRIPIRETITIRTSNNNPITKLFWRKLHSEELVLLHNNHLHIIRPHVISQCIEEPSEDDPIHSRYVLNTLYVFRNRNAFTGNPFVSAIDVPGSTTYKVYKYYPRTLYDYLKLCLPTLPQHIDVMRQICQALITLREHNKSCLSLRDTILVKDHLPLTIIIDKDGSTCRNLPEDLDNDIPSTKESGDVWTLGVYFCNMLTREVLNLLMYTRDGFEDMVQRGESSIRVCV